MSYVRTDRSLAAGALPEFAANLASMMPPPAERAAQLGVKRSFESTSAEFADSMMRTALVPAPEASHAPGFLDALGPSLASRTSSLDAGSSRLKMRADAPVYSAIIAKPPRTGWTESYDETVPIWVATGESAHATSSNAMHTIADVPTLNYYAQETIMLASSSTVMRADRRRELERQARLDRPYLFATAREFDERWDYLGAISSLPEGSIDPLAIGHSMRGNRQRLVPYVASGSARIRNLFGEQVRVGDWLYFVVSERTVASNAFVAPSGETITPIAGLAGVPQLMVTGWSSRDGASYPLLSTRLDEPSDSDVDYTRRQVRVAQTYRTKEWDDERGTFRVRNVAAEEGAQEAIAQAESDSVFIDMHGCGHVEPVGLVMRVEGADPDVGAIEAAHRSSRAMMQLPVLKYQSGLFA